MRRKQVSFFCAVLLIFFASSYAKDRKQDFKDSKDKARAEELIANEAEYKTVTTEELLARIKRGEEFILIDCRPADEYKAGHIPGAVNVSIDSFAFSKDTVVKDSIEKIKENEGREIHFVLIDSATGEEYMPKSKILEIIAALPENKEEKAIFYCRRPSCTRSPLAARWAVALGYRNVFRYERGWEGWKDKKYPVEK